MYLTQIRLCEGYVCQHDVEAIIMHPGFTLTGIMIFYESRPSFLTVNNTDLMDMDIYLSNKRNEKINDILE